MTTTKEEMGGYYAIKGFTYQFDKTLIEILNNKDKNIQIERMQDIGINDYYIQIKHKESQNFSPSKIKTATIQLLEQFVSNNKLKFRLYCYFKDRSVQTKVLSLQELDEIIGKESGSYTEKDKKLFIENFILEFSDNFENQFKKVIGLIKENFNLKDEEAIIHHASLRSNLIDISIKRSSSEREVTFSLLKDLVNKNERIIFELAHYKYLKNEKTVKYIKKEYFTLKGVNISTKERLFLIDVDEDVKDNDVLQIIINIKNRYYKKNSSPAPYIVLLNSITPRIMQLKQKLWDSHVYFGDGTHFNGDKFRMNDLVNKSEVDCVKLLDKSNLKKFLKEKNIHEIYVFLTDKSHAVGELNKAENIKEFYISQTKDIIKIIT